MQAFDHVAVELKYFPNPIYSYIRDANGNVVYAGISERGALKSQPRWLILKFILAEDMNIDDVRRSEFNQIFDNYADSSLYA